MFGTFYLPDGVPQRLGLDEGPPKDFVGQTLWPAHYFLSAVRPRVAPPTTDVTVEA
jgi:hypothetical protein